MEVLLRSDVEGLGKRGDIVEVAKGFARNFLIPTGKGIIANPGVRAQAEAMRRARDLRDARDREAAEVVARAIAGRTITVTARAGSEGRLFGSVTSADLSEAIKAQTGAAVDRRQILLEEPIKRVGAHTVAVRLHGDVRTEVTVEVTAAS